MQVEEARDARAHSPSFKQTHGLTPQTPKGTDRRAFASERSGMVSRRVAVHERADSLTHYTPSASPHRPQRPTLTTTQAASPRRTTSRVGPGSPTPRSLFSEGAAGSGARFANTHADPSSYRAADLDPTADRKDLDPPRVTSGLSSALRANLSAAGGNSGSASNHMNNNNNSYNNNNNNNTNSNNNNSPGGINSTPFPSMSSSSGVSNNYTSSSSTANATPVSPGSYSVGSSAGTLSPPGPSANWETSGSSREREDSALRHSESFNTTQQRLKERLYKELQAAKADLVAQTKEGARLKAEVQVPHPAAYTRITPTRE
jgi:hypothetical protein